MTDNITEEWLIAKGWKLVYDVYVLFSQPRLGWKSNGTFYIGYHTYPEKVFSIKQLETIISNYAENNNSSDFEEKRN